MSKLNVSIIGCGNIFDMHAKPIYDNDYVDLVSVVDIDKSRAAKASDFYGCKYYTDYIKMLHEDKADAVHICTPHYLHSEMAIHALNHKKHVLIEKPMALTLNDADKIIEASKKNNRKLGVCLQNRYNKTSKIIKQKIENGQSGRILGAKAFLTWHRDKEYYESAKWRGTWKEEGGGLLINQAIHTLDLLRWFMGDIKSIRGSIHTQQLQDYIEVEDTAQALLSFESGAQAVFFATNCYVKDSPVEIEIVAENMTINLSNNLTIHNSDGSVEIVDVCENEVDKTFGKNYWGYSHKEIINDFYDSIINNSRFAVDGLEGKKALELVLKIYDNAKVSY